MKISPSNKEADFWKQNITDLIENLNTTPSGLTSAEAASRLTSFGPNQLHPLRKRMLFIQFLSKFRNPLVIVLLFASFISALTGDIPSFLIISAIIFISVTIDFVQEHKAGQAAERLRQSVTVRVTVSRDNKPVVIPLAEVVPGDIVLLCAGDLVPGDGRVIETKDFFVNQALLTGEPYPVEKSPGELPEEKQRGKEAVALSVVAQGG